MTEVEVNSIAEAMGDTALQDMYMEVVEQDPKTHTFYVKCRYDGPTIKHGQRLILHGMRLWIKCPYDDWAGLSKALKKA